MTNEPFSPIITIEGEEPQNATTAATDAKPSPASNVTVNSDGKSATVTDTRGRLIKVKKLGALERMRLFKVVGKDAGENDRYMGFAGLAACATEIAGQPTPFPANLLQLEARVQHLDDDGLNAIADALITLTPDTDEVKEDARFLSSAQA